MCLIVFALDTHPRYRLVLAANRDEYFRRPTAPAAFWQDAPQILAGRDMEAGGTWLGVTTTGRIAAITNYRQRPVSGTPLPSRGGLVAAFLSGGMTRDEYRQVLEREGRRYGGFNLIFGDDSGLSYWSNRGSAVARISPGSHGLSNHLLDTPWPKVAVAREGLERLLRGADIAPEALLSLLADPGQFPDELLPDTGIGSDLERVLSPLFITGVDYGTRSSTVILIDRDGHVTFQERSFDDTQRVCGNVIFRFGPGRDTLP
jgi:uncharacterized protein with NRDE domain